MGFDGFNFSTNHLVDKKYGKDGFPAIVCECGRVTTDHTPRELRRCRVEQEAA